MRDWRVAVLKAIGAPVTKANLRFLANWHRYEGGHTKNNARWNWLNTTQDAPGAIGSINSVGVKAFDSFESGVLATAATLMNGRYDDIVQALISGNPYKRDVSRGLQIWVSGRPDGNPEYARRIMGGGAPSGGGGTRSAPKPRRPSSSTPYGHSSPAPSKNDIPPLMKLAFEDDPVFLDLLRSILHRRTTTPMNVGPGIMVPKSWKGTHVTSGLGWGTKTAIDIMGKPGTPVRLPWGGTVVYFHPTGAQGGGSMLVRLEDGRKIWLGHIAQGLQPGQRFRAGQAVAVISPDHKAPHVHADIRP
ncbi:MAG: hypothetical protein KatS3mg015_2818 [Fimbriimonadales bacterium]|nr:MAG: hypothetical protein KatS3mg015_2818 [Fimbriimonadales bacterium]